MKNLIIKKIKGTNGRKSSYYVADQSTGDRVSMVYSMYSTVEGVLANLQREQDQLRFLGMTHSSQTMH